MSDAPQMNEQTRDLMNQARAHIKAERYDKARKILAIVAHPTARKWEARLDELDPAGALLNSPATKASSGGGMTVSGSVRAFFNTLLFLGIGAALVGAGIFAYIHFGAQLGGALTQPSDAQLERPADQRWLFIGNSFTANNDLDLMAARLAEAAVPGWDTVVATRLAPVGFRVEDHYRILATGDGGRHREFLIEGSEALRDWDLVVVQPQSQISGLTEAESAEKGGLIRTLPLLVDAIGQTGAQPMLLMTWGYADGDPVNAAAYPDYVAMQARLASNAYALANFAQPRTFVIPVGLGFRQIYEASADPLAPGSDFRALYADRSGHPSLQGSYLAAAMTVAAYSGQRVADADWVPRGLDEATAARLRAVADAVVFDNAQGQATYPWQ